MLVPSVLWRLLDIYQHGEGWGHLEGWIKRVIISALLPMSAFLWWVWTMRRMAPHSIVSNTSYTTSCLASFSFSFLPPSIPCLCLSLPLFFLSSIPFISALYFMRDTVVILPVPQIRMSGHMGTQNNHSLALEVCSNQFTLSENWSQSFGSILLKIWWAVSTQKSIEMIALVCCLEMFFQF